MNETAEAPVETAEPAAQPEPEVTTDHSIVSSAMVIDLKPKKIKIPKSRQRQIDWNDEKNQMFLDSIRRVGILHPPEVRKVGDDYELVFGQRRVAAAKKLELPTIPVRVSNWNDAQVEWVALAENTQRQHLEYPKWIRKVQDLMKALESWFGPDPGKAAGGLTRAREAKRDPETQTFVPEPQTEPVPHTNGEPARVSGTLAGSEPETPAPEASDEERSHRSLIAEATGRSPYTVAKDMQIARALTSEQIDVLEAFGASKEDLLALARIEDKQIQSAAVNLMAGGYSLEKAVEDARTMFGNTEQGEQRREQFRVAELPDAEWLDAACGSLRKLLQDTTAFDRDALLYRHNTTERHAYRAKSKDLVLKSLRHGWSPFAQFMKNLCWVDSPDKWYLCAECNGKNADKPECDHCKGCGYKVRVTVPEGKNKH